ncbi:hypothetical protein EXIGLDRAFT_40850 [Exidia glandulosa HHB12029]|uniref:Uncharacterized protein n=1 Tax=Exidia glandulosa HHB12029 TaxID=1314781 RepID=A0A165IM55_EXIGL|nr:hypothetical protein EXIGLDRAFT_40850 [Exidia glandulosa HHB12029]
MKFSQLEVKADLVRAVDAALHVRPDSRRTPHRADSRCGLQREALETDVDVVEHDLHKTTIIYRLGRLCACGDPRVQCPRVRSRRARLRDQDHALRALSLRVSRWTLARRISTSRRRLSTAIS